MPATGEKDMSHLWWLRPLQAAAVLTSAKSFRDNAVIGSPELNRRGLHVARRMAAARLGERRRAMLADRLDAVDRAALDRDGFLVKPGFLDPATFQALYDEVMRLELPAREAVIGDVLTRLIPLDTRRLRTLPTLRSVLEGRTFRSLLDYAGSFRRRPNLYVQTVFSRFCEGPPDVQSFFHADTFHPTVKAWLYLSDVGEADAPLAYVPGSHRHNRRRLAFERRVSQSARTAGDQLTAEGSIRFSEVEIRRLGYPDPVRLPVQANTLIVADTSGIHRRTPAAGTSTRVAIWAYARSNPFAPFVGGDVAGAATVRDAFMAFYRWVSDRKPRSLASNWSWAGVRRPLSPAPPPSTLGLSPPDADEKMKLIV